MQQTQQPVQAKPVVVQAQQKPVIGQTTQIGQPVKKKPTRWWIGVIVAIIVIGGVIWAYFQFLN